MLNSELYLNPQIFDTNAERLPTRDGYGKGLVELGDTNSNIFVLTGDLAESTRAHHFLKKYPERFVECGVAEQNMMGVAAGLSLAGKIPFVSSYAVFVPGRNWDQLRVSVCYSKSNVKVAGAHAGISVGPDGATHQALEDLAITRVLPNLIVIVPCDMEETRKCTHAVAEIVGPCYFRFERDKTPVITTIKTPFKIGKANICWEGTHVTIAACGPLLYEALVAARELDAEGINAEVLNCHTLKPFDHSTLESSVQKTGCCVSVEDHQITGGLGGAIAESLGAHTPVPLERIGMPDHFGESGQTEELLTKYGMKAKDIANAAKRAIKRKV